jgi:cytochrome c-type biogenesis protein CcmE
VTDERPLHDGPDDRDLDEGGLDLTPRAAGPARTGSAGRRRWVAVGVLVVLAGLLAFIVVQARGASLYYRNADEAVAQKASLGTDRFRLQGVVVGKPSDAGDAVMLTVAYKGVAVKVRHTGSEPPLFKAGLPVVCEGHWNAAGTEFESSRLLVKHTENYKKADDGDYEEQHPDRVDPESSAPALRTSAPRTSGPTA